MCVNVNVCVCPLLGVSFHMCSDDKRMRAPYNRTLEYLKKRELCWTQDGVNKNLKTPSFALKGICIHSKASFFFRYNGLKFPEQVGLFFTLQL